MSRKVTLIRSSHPEVLLAKGVLKKWSKFTGEHPCWSAISIKLQIEIALRHGCFPVNLLHIFRTPFLKNISGWLLLTNHDTATNHISICRLNGSCSRPISRWSGIFSYVPFQSESIYVLQTALFFTFGWTPSVEFILYQICW